MKFTLRARIFVEFLGTLFLVAAVVGSGIMAERLSPGNAAIALLANAIATGAALFAIIAALAPVSGAHLNPAVTLSLVIVGDFSWPEAWPYMMAQLFGGVSGTLLAHLMFGLPLFSLSVHSRGGMGIVFSEFVATFGLVWVILLCSQWSSSVAPFAIASYITGAYWFTASTSFANPAVTIARAFSNTFVGIRPMDVPFFVLAQIAGACMAAIIVQRVRTDVVAAK